MSADPKVVRARPESTFRRLIAHFDAVGRMPRTVDSTAAPDLVPMPLPAGVWSQAVFRRRVAPADLFAAVMSDAAAARLAHGLAALDDETLRFLVGAPRCRDAAVRARLRGVCRVRRPSSDSPQSCGAARRRSRGPALGGRAAGAGRRTRKASCASCSRGDAGRLAYLYDTIGHLDAARASFALGFWIEDASLRVERFGALARVASESFNEWDVRKLPFSRPSADLLTMFSRLHVDATGAPGFPAARWVWARAFAGGNVWDERASGPPPIGHDQLVDAAWLAENLMSGHSRWRMERLDQFGFGATCVRHRGCSGSPGRARVDPDVPPGSHVDADARAHRRPPAGAVCGARASGPARVGARRGASVARRSRSSRARLRSSPG